MLRPAVIGRIAGVVWAYLETLECFFHNEFTRITVSCIFHAEVEEAGNVFSILSGVNVQIGATRCQLAKRSSGSRRLAAAATYNLSEFLSVLSQSSASVEAKLITARSLSERRLLAAIQTGTVSSKSRMGIHRPASRLCTRWATQCFHRREKWTK
jgi:hypothetical protein